MKIYKKPVSNFKAGRENCIPDTIVIHIGEGSQQAIYNTFLTEQKSSHYCVAKNGEIWQFVDENDTAWANGVVVRPTANVVLNRPNTSPNLYTISIEHEGLSTQDITEAQYQATAELVHDICKRRNIAIDRTHIIPHREIRADKTCPGKINVEKIIALANGESPQIAFLKATIARLTIQLAALLRMRRGV